MRKILIYNQNTKIDKYNWNTILSPVKPDEIFMRPALPVKFGNDDLFIIFGVCELMPTQIDFDGILDLARTEDCIICALPVVDTAKQIDNNGIVIKTPNRKRLRKIVCPLIIKGFIFEKLISELGDMWDLEQIIELLSNQNQKIKIWQVK